MTVCKEYIISQKKKEKDSLCSLNYLQEKKGNTTISNEGSKESGNDTHEHSSVHSHCFSSSSSHGGIE